MVVRLLAPVSGEGGGGNGRWQRRWKLLCSCSGGGCFRDDSESSEAKSDARANNIGR